MTSQTKRHETAPGAPADLDAALVAWREALGPEHVVTNAGAIAAAERATFATAQRIPAILRPGSVEEVQACLRVATRFGVPVYPISGGKNWGFGSRVPAADGCALLDLGRLNQIREHDERLAYVTVEAGVTFRQLHAFLATQQSRLMLSPIGGSTAASIVGNAVERGFGQGPYTDRFAHCCGLEVVLPDGRLIQTGFARFPGAHAAPVSRWGLGPVIDGLFAQGNFGVVTALSHWLAPRPNSFQAANFAIQDVGRLPGLIDALQELRLRGPLRAGVGIWNSWRAFASLRQYPWDAVDGRTPFPPSVLDRIRTVWWADKWVSGAWIGWFGLYSASEAVGRAERAVVTDILGPAADRLVFVDDVEVDVTRWDPPGDQEHVARFFQTMGSGGFLGDVGDVGGGSEDSAGVTYWRKRIPVPDDPDPDRDHCGVIWIAPAVPFTGEHVQRASAILADTMFGHGFEPVVQVACVSERLAIPTGVLLYDRDVPGEDERALMCHDAALDALQTAGYFPYRLGIQAMERVPDDETTELLRSLKRLLDPGRVLAPGRYEPVGDAT